MYSATNHEHSVVHKPTGGKAGMWVLAIILAIIAAISFKLCDKAIDVGICTHWDQTRVKAEIKKATGGRPVPVNTYYKACGAGSVA